MNAERNSMFSDVSGIYQKIFNAMPLLAMTIDMRISNCQTEQIFFLPPNTQTQVHKRERFINFFLNLFRSIKRI